MWLMASTRRSHNEDEMMLEVEQVHATSESGKARRVFFKSIRMHGLKACESSDNQAARAERTALLRITGSRLSRCDSQTGAITDSKDHRHSPLASLPSY